LAGSLAVAALPNHHLTSPRLEIYLTSVGNLRRLSRRAWLDQQPAMSNYLRVEHKPDRDFKKLAGTYKERCCPGCLNMFDTIAYNKHCAEAVGDDFKLNACTALCKTNNLSDRCKQLALVATDHEATFGIGLMHAHVKHRIHRCRDYWMKNINAVCYNGHELQSLTLARTHQTTGHSYVLHMSDI
jgi:hypothetical protein